MKLVSFNFTKIHAERKKSTIKELKVDTKINVDSIKEIKSNISEQKDSILAVEFDYSIEYKDLATIEFKGTVVLLEEPKKAKQIIKDFESKKISDDFKISVFNIILKKASLRALQLEEELNLPTHFRLPSLKPKSSK